ncbi:MAG TPA: hypothetical protein VF427_10295, partial [Noviherbaspirillum sp.]
MVAIVSGNSLGLNLTSLTTLGQQGVTGSAGQGRNGEKAYINAATGNLVLQNFDDRLVAHGVDIARVRTYNSQGQYSDDNNDDNWIGLYRYAKANGPYNKAGSTITRTDTDGSESVYTYDVNKGVYVSTGGAGAYDTIAYDKKSQLLTWTDGETGIQERYASTGLGRMLSTTDPSGNTVTYSYSPEGNLTKVVDASGEATYFDYVNKDLTQVRTVIQSDGVEKNVTRVLYGYDDKHRLTTITVDLSSEDNSIADGRIYQTQYTYDGATKRIASVTQTDGTSLAFTYVQIGPDFKVATATDGLGNVTRFTYDVANRRTTATDPLGFVTTYDYDAKGQLVKLTGPSVNGVRQVTQYTYDANGNVTRIVDGEGHTVVMEYDGNGNQTLQRDNAGNTIVRSFGARFNELLTETVYAVPDPDGAGAGKPAQPLTTRYVYTDTNLLRFIISPEGRVTEYRYNSYGERTASIQYTDAMYSAGGQSINASPGENAMQQWVAGIDRSRSVRSDMVYDFRGQLKTATTYAKIDANGNGILDGSQAVTQYIYDQSGHLLSTIDAKGNQTQYNYDGLWRLLSTTDALGQTTLTQYDDAHNKTVIRLANGLTTTSAYDKAGRLVSVTQTDTAALKLGETRYTYDADNRLRMTEDPTGVRQFMLYDEAGRKIADIDGNGSLTEYLYNKDNQLTKTIAYATAVDTGLLVDAQGSPADIALSAIRPASTADDRVTWRSYDLANRLVKLVDERGFVTENIYDGASRVTQAIRYATAINTAVLSNTPAPSAISPSASAEDRVTRNLYDKDGLLRATLDGEGYLVEYRYDARGQQVEKIAYANATPQAARASGTLADLLPVVSADDIHSYTLYNARGQAVGRVDGEGYLTETVYDLNGNVAQTVRYQNKVAYFAGATLANLRPAASAEDQSQQYVYDPLNRLSVKTNTEGTQTTYTYDAVGNVIRTVNAAGTGEVRTITARYDLQGRLSGELSAEGSALLTGNQTQQDIDAIWAAYGIRHTYDAAGRRTSTTDANGNKTLFYYNRD